MFTTSSQSPSRSQTTKSNQIRPEQHPPNILYIIQSTQTRMRIRIGYICWMVIVHRHSSNPNNAIRLQRRPLLNYGRPTSGICHYLHLRQFISRLYWCPFLHLMVRTLTMVIVYCIYMYIAHTHNKPRNCVLLFYKKDTGQKGYYTKDDIELGKEIEYRQEDIKR